MAAFMGKDVKKLKGKGGGKVSKFPGFWFPIPHHDLCRKTGGSAPTPTTVL